MGSHTPGVGREHRIEAKGMCKNHRRSGGCGHKAGEVCWQVHVAGHVHDQNSIEAGNQSRKEGSVWQACDGEGKAREDCGKSLPSIGAEEMLLRSAWCTQKFRSVSTLVEISARLGCGLHATA